MHIHRYRRVNIGKDKTYYVMQCRKPNCTHYTPMQSKGSCPTLIDKQAECNRCGNPFVLDRRALRLAEPICFGCVNRKNLKDADEFFKELEESI